MTNDNIATEALAAVNGPRRADYGPVEENFARIARFWSAYLQNIGHDVTLSAGDVAPMMRMVKEARLCRTPAHRDSLVDLVGYALLGADMSGVKE